MLRLLAMLSIALLAAQGPAYAQKGNGAPDVSRGPDLVSRAKPQGDSAAWIVDSDYPPNALRAEAEGQVGLVLQIGTDGRVSDCTVLASSGATALDATSCEVLTRRARFTPAMGRDRNPVPDRWNYTVVWKMPSDYTRVEEPLRCVDCGFGPVVVIRIPSPEPIGDPDLWLQGADTPAALLANGGSVDVILTVSPSGRTRRCQIIASSGILTWDRQVCSILRHRARFQPEREAGEKWVSHGWQHLYSWGPATAR